MSVNDWYEDLWDGWWGDSGERLAELREASSAKELWRLLVAGGSSWHDSTCHQEAVELFCRHHGKDSAGAADTALLLCTDERWYRCTAKLLAGILDTGVLDHAALDVLAALFFWQDAVDYRHPAAWLDLEWDQSTPEGRFLADPDREITTTRQIRPPLRRWAAAHLLRRGRTTVEAVHRRARKLRRTTEEFAVITGMLDACDGFDEPTARRVIAIGRSCGSGPVRLRALQVLAGYDGQERARRLARADTDARVRRWAGSRSG